MSRPFKYFLTNAKHNRLLLNSAAIWKSTSINHSLRPSQILSFWTSLISTPFPLALIASWTCCYLYIQTLIAESSIGPRSVSTFGTKALGPRPSPLHSAGNQRTDRPANYRAPLREWMSWTPPGGNVAPPLLDSAALSNRPRPFSAARGFEMSGYSRLVNVGRQRILILTFD